MAILPVSTVNLSALSETTDNEDSLSSIITKILPVVFSMKLKYMKNWQH